MKEMRTIFILLTLLPSPFDWIIAGATIHKLGSNIRFAVTTQCKKLTSRNGAIHSVSV